jgi:hypothetical protein
MYVSNERITVIIGTQAKTRLMELRAVLQGYGHGSRETDPGKILAKLIESEGALEYLREEYRK